MTSRFINISNSEAKGSMKQKHSEILSKVEKSLHHDIDVASVNRVATFRITEPDCDLVPGKKLLPGEYGVVDMRVIFPISSK